MISSLEGRPIADPNRLFFKTGKRRKLWNKNCVAIGLAGGFLEPLESTSIDLIQSGITNLIALFPERYCDQRDVNEYNRLMDLEFERIRDFLMLHYVANQRDEPFWRDIREMTVPDSLKDKIEAFEKRGLVPEYADGLFQPPSWLSVFIGQNFKAEKYDPRADLMDEADLKEQLERIEKSVASKVADTPGHLEFIQSSGAAFEAEALSQR